MDIRELAERIQVNATQNAADAAAILAQLPPPPGVPVLPAGGDLQKALDTNDVVSLEDGATWTGNFKLKSGNRLVGAKSSIIGGKAGPAIYIPPGTHDVQVSLASAITAWDDAVVLVGEGGALQNRVEDAPTYVVLRVSVPTHRGKRAFYLNQGEGLDCDSSCRDVYDPAGRDSNGVLFFNAPGGKGRLQGSYEAGSECVLFGGGATGIPGVVTRGMVCENMTLPRPLSWMTDGVHHKVKNSFELKQGEDIIVRKSKISVCYVEGQVGWAIMITPRDGKPVRRILFEDIDISDVGGFASILGYDDGAFGPQCTNITFRRVRGTANASSAWGPGRFLQLQASPANIEVDDCSFDGPGNTLYANPGKVWTDPNTQVMGNTMMGINVHDSRLSLRTYGIQLNGNPYAAQWQAAWPDGKIENNSFFGVPAGATKTYVKNLPASNTYVEGP